MLHRQQLEEEVPGLMSILSSREDSQILLSTLVVWRTHARLYPHFSSLNYFQAYERSAEFDRSAFAQSIYQPLPLREPHHLFYQVLEMLQSHSLTYHFTTLLESLVHLQVTHSLSTLHPIYHGL